MNSIVCLMFWVASTKNLSSFLNFHANLSCPKAGAVRTPRASAPAHQVLRNIELPPPKNSYKDHSLPRLTRLAGRPRSPLPSEMHPWHVRRNTPLPERLVSEIDAAGRSAGLAARFA